MATTLTAFRVESKNNLGDTGSRVESDEDLHDLMRLNAPFVSPSHPSFVNDDWNPFPRVDDSHYLTTCMF